jgi:hypothetical protein
MNRTIAFALFLCASSLYALPNLVTNGSFASGLTGWSSHTCGSCEASGWDAGSTQSDSGTMPSAPNEAEDACVGATCNDPANGDWISQTLTTAPGQSYTLSFYYDPGDGGTNELTALWNGSVVSGGTILNATDGTWQLYTFNVTATGASTVLEFTGRQDPDELHLTGISVVAAGAAPPTTPAPRSLSLLLIGLAGVAIWRYSAGGRTPFSAG